MVNVWFQGLQYTHKQPTGDLLHNVPSFFGGYQKCWGSPGMRLYTMGQVPVCCGLPKKLGACMGTRQVSPNEAYT